MEDLHPPPDVQVPHTPPSTNTRRRRNVVDASTSETPIAGIAGTPVTSGRPKRQRNAAKTEARVEPEKQIRDTKAHPGPGNELDLRNGAEDPGPKTPSASSSKKRALEDDFDGNIKEPVSKKASPSKAPVAQGVADPSTPTKSRAQKASKKRALQNDSDDDIKEPVSKKASPSKAPVAQEAADPSTPTESRARKASKKRRAARIQSKTGLATWLPPMSDINQIFSDMTNKAISLGFSQFLDSMGSRPLIIGTMCSGTESPILALKKIQVSLNREHKKQFDISHVFSAEIEPFKQAYIERNFHPPILFRDVREMCNDTATNAWGTVKEVPGGLDILVAGSSCVDFSNLNNKKAKVGESAVTLDAILDYLHKFTPTTLVLENVLNAPWDKLTALFEKHGYLATYVKVDTRDYYLPQTRNRGYLVAIDGDKTLRAGLDPHKVLGDWKSLMEQFERPASSHVLDFMLPQEDPRFQQARRDIEFALQGRKESEWVKCKARHIEYRGAQDFGPQRPFTDWKEGGTASFPDYAFTQWGKCQVQRVWDTLDINLLRAVDSGYDPRHVARFWDLSQSVDRETDSRPPGIQGCVTPSGQPYSSFRGGPIFGCETLGLQGLDTKVLLLTRENQKQLQDLAGNAMSSTVVGAAMLSAMIAGRGIFTKGPKRGENDLVIANPEKTLLDEIRLKESCHDEQIIDLGPCEFPTVPALVSSVLPHVRLCTCEGSTLLKATEFFRCTKCFHTVCKFCQKKREHQHEDVIPISSSNRDSFDTCRRRIMEALPMRLILQGLSIEDWHSNLDYDLEGVAKEKYDTLIESIADSLGEELRFLEIKRTEDWTIVYDGVKSKLELSISPRGVQWSLFAKVNPSEPGDSDIRDRLNHPIARMTPHGDSFLDGVWEIKYPEPHVVELNISGQENQIKCPEAELGLQDPVYRTQRIWTNLHIDCTPPVSKAIAVELSGEYEYVGTCGAAMNSMYRQKATASLPTLLLLEQDIYGKLPDKFIFCKDSRRLDAGVDRELLASIKEGELELIKVPADGTSISILSGVPRWKPCAQVKLNAFKEQSPATYFMPTTDPGVTIVPGACKSNYITALQCSAYIGKEPGFTSYASTFDSRTSTWLTERMRHIPALDSWNPIPCPDGDPDCPDCVPNRPLIVWRQEIRTFPKKDPTFVFQAYEDEISAGEFERKVKARPEAVVKQAWIDESGTARVAILLNPATLAHRARAGLRTTAMDDDVLYTWRVASGETLMQCPPAARFTIPNTKEWEYFQGESGFKDGFELRPEQSRSVAWMHEMDQIGVPAFSHEEVEEVFIPEMAWRLEVKASTQRAVFGGILADDVGYGKTATTYALINSTRLSEAPLIEVQGAISVKATLILTPVRLVSQWNKEGETKFCKGKRKVIKIFAWNDWDNITMQEVIDSDLVIMSWHLLLTESYEPYLKKVQEFAACRDYPHNPKTAGRATADWFQAALSLIEEHVEVLKAGDLTDFVKHLDERLNQLREEDKDCIVFSQSRRADSKVYASSAAPDDAALLDDENKEVREAKIAARQSNMRQTFSISDNMKDPRKENMKGVLLHMFFFRRIVMDEITYLEKHHLLLLITLKAHSNWLLTATPAMNTFAEISFMARLQGINLGIDDNDISPTTVTARNKAAQTAAEAFAAYEERHSLSWHVRRIEIAQIFLNTFVRKNQAEHAEIKSVEYIVEVVLSPAEQGIYIELFHRLYLNDYHLTSGKKSKCIDNDRLHRLAVLGGLCKTPQQALLHAAADFIAPSGEVQGNPSQACDQIAAARRRQKQTLIDELQSLFKHAEWLEHKLSDSTKKDKENKALSKAKKQTNFYDNFKKLVEQGTLDDSVAAVLAQVMADAQANYLREHGNLFYSAAAEEVDPKKTNENEEPENPEPDPAAEVADASDQQDADQQAPDYEDSHHEDSDHEGSADGDYNPEPEEEPDDEPEPPKKKGKKGKAQAKDKDKPKPKPFPKNAEDTLSELKLVCISLRKCTADLQDIERGLNFFEHIRQFQDLRNVKKSKTKKPSSFALTCAGCSAQLQHADCNISVACGHVVCQSCLVIQERTTVCLQDGCTAEFGLALDVAELLLRASSPPPSMDHSSKIGTLIQLLEGEIGGPDKIEKKDQVLLFVQFDYVKARVMDALKARNITYVTIDNSDKKRKNVNDPLEAFHRYNKPHEPEENGRRGCDTWPSKPLVGAKKGGKTGQAVRGAQVLILDVDSSDAAGHNLTDASHVIFFAPVVASNRQRYWANITQAIGRARRFGQKEVVKIWRILSLHTIDVNIVEARENKTLVKRGNSFYLVDRNDVQGDDVAGWYGRSIPVDGEDEQDFRMD